MNLLATLINLGPWCTLQHSIALTLFLLIEQILMLRYDVGEMIEVMPLLSTETAKQEKKECILAANDGVTNQCKYFTQFDLYRFLDSVHDMTPLILFRLESFGYKL
ncbi:hypothetical protein PsorP6_007649 [Peronosclerospora sorghi]|uniref:Uncharacterized protein n=1 Tax=Peronosclerospora sorghi TaxID=230839 RepID=A0ACC0WA04_9STRA|nr:hypothetical protein PsorP6_007649 [Peronosclerospora sorghi]